MRRRSSNEVKIDPIQNAVVDMEASSFIDHRGREVWHRNTEGEIILPGSDAYIALCGKHGLARTNLMLYARTGVLVR